MNELRQLSGLSQNVSLWVALICWFVAQFLKAIIGVIQDHRWDWRKFMQAGGMPSSHSATVVGLAVSLGLRYGWDQPVTALAIIFCWIVMYDAAGVRRAAGIQARLLNEISDILSETHELPTKKLKELLGHTPMQVVMGALLGITIAVIMVKIW